MAVCVFTVAYLFTKYLAAIPSLLLAAPVAMVIAALIEWVQPWFGRTSSLADFLWGMAGILGGCLWQGAAQQNSKPVALTTYMLALFCALAPPTLWCVQVWLVQAEAQRLFPTLVQSSRPGMHLLWTIEPSQVRDRGKGPCLLLTRDANHPGSIHLDTLDRDWSDYEGLEISGTLQSDSAVEVGVRLDVNEDGARRIRAGGWMQAGTSSIQIVWPRNADRRLVHQLVVFLQASSKAAQLEIHRLRLIGARELPPKETSCRNSSTKKIPSAGLHYALIAQ